MDFFPFFMTQRAVGSQNESLADGSGRRLFTTRREPSALFFLLFFFFFCSAPPIPLLPHCWDDMDEAREKSQPAVSIEEKQQREGKAWHCCFVCDGKETGKQKNIINHHKYLLSCVGSKKERNLHYIVCTLFTCTRAAPSGLMTDPPPV